MQVYHKGNTPKSKVWIWPATLIAFIAQKYSGAVYTLTVYVQNVSMTR